MAKTDYGIKSLEAALEIIDVFTLSNKYSLKYTELCKLTGFSNNRVYRILATLCERGFLEKNPKTSEYQIGPAFLLMVHQYRKNHRGLLEISIPVLQDLARQTGDCSALTVRYRDHSMITIEAFQGTNALQAQAEIGVPFPLHVGAASKFLLYAIPEDERSIILESIAYTQYTDKTICNRHMLEVEIQRAINQGYYEAKDDWVDGLVAVTAPVRDVNGQIIACVSLLIPSMRYDDIYKEGAVQSIFKAAKNISKGLGFIDVNQ